VRQSDDDHTVQSVGSRDRAVPKEGRAMDAESYRTKRGKTRWRPVVTEDELMELDTTGFCVACGVEVLGVEPDARQYACEDCGEETVYGLEELVLMGLVRIVGDEEER
jgi:predicted RNA-binding Zn-ribbon protein involved in translation (DUF1610 family)